MLPASRYKVIDFDPSAGSDERQYGSPGFNLPVGSLIRSVYGQYPEYHTSMDNKSYISFKAMVETVEMFASMVRAIEGNAVYRSLHPFGEPFLSRHGLFRSVSRPDALVQSERALFWMLNQADGKQDLLEISKLSGISFDLLQEQTMKCVKAGILKVIR
jgi:aminopeptidase-like protein